MDMIAGFYPQEDGARVSASVVGDLEPNLIHVIPQLRKIGTHRREPICAHHERTMLINYFNRALVYHHGSKTTMCAYFSWILLAVLH